jgi:CheR methyltransferase, SAM binding domain
VLRHQVFVEEEGGYRVGKALREMIVFARQNVMSDPPFSRLDIISCRNLLITDAREGSFGFDRQRTPHFPRVPTKSPTIGATRNETIPLTCEWLLGPGQLLLV